MAAERGADRGTVALTGATGFIGGAVLRRLTASGWRVRALYRSRRGRILPRASGIDWVAGDLDDDCALARLVAGADAVIHCAGAVRGARRADFARVNVAGTRHVVDAAARGAPAARFLLLSSLAAREPDLSDYAWSKRRGEEALQAGAGALRWTILRPPAVYGPGDREMLPLFRGMARGFATVPGRGVGRVSLLYVEDLASAILAWLAGDVDPGQAYELDDGAAGGYGWDELLGIAARVLRGGAAIRKLPMPVWLLRCVAAGNLGAARVLGYPPMLTPGKVRELMHQDWVADGGPFGRATGWHPAWPLARGLAVTLASDRSARRH